MATSLGERLREAREGMGWTQTDVSRMTGIPNLNISTYERGTRKPDIEVLTTLADLYHVSLDYLAKGYIEDGQPTQLSILDDETRHFVSGVFTAFDPSRWSTPTQIVMIPCFNSNQLAPWMDKASIVQYIPMLASELQLPKYNYYGLKISDDAMKAEGIHKNMVVLVRACETDGSYQDGSIRVVPINQELSLRRVFEQKSVVCLQAANPEYPLQTIQPEGEYAESWYRGQYGLGEVVRIIRNIDMVGH